MIDNIVLVFMHTSFDYFETFGSQLSSDQVIIISNIHC